MAVAGLIMTQVEHAACANMVPCVFLNQIGRFEFLFFLDSDSLQSLCPM